MKTLCAHTASDVKRPKNIRILQFGLSNAALGFCDYLVDSDGKAKGDVPGIAVVRTGNEEIWDALRAQDGLYHVLVCDEKGADTPYLISSLCCFLDAQQDEKSLKEIACSASVRYIFYCACEQTDDFAPFLAALAFTLKARFHSGEQGFVFLANDPMACEGAILRDLLCRFFLENGEDETLIAWIKKENAFPDSVLDCLSAGFPAQEERVDEIFKRIQYRDMCLHAAEKNGKWLIAREDTLESFFPQTDDISLLKERKALYRDILCASIYTFSACAYLMGCDTLEQCMRDEAVRAFFGHALLNEIIPCVTIEKERVDSYVVEMCRRFENQALNYSLAYVLRHFTVKWKKCVLPLIKTYCTMNSAAPDCLTFGLAALIMFFSGVRSHAKGYAIVRENQPCSVSENEETLRAFSHLACDMPADSLAYAVMADRSIWDEDLRDIPGFEEKLKGMLLDIQLLGMRDAMEKAWKG